MSLRIDPQADMQGIVSTAHCVMLRPAGADGYAAGTYAIYVQTKSGGCDYVTDEQAKRPDAQGLRWQFFSGTGKSGTQFYLGFEAFGSTILEISPRHGRDDAAGLAKLQANVRAATA